MGRSSSASRKKKRSKVTSQARARKSSKIGSRKYESKKLRRHVSDDDDDSRSPMSSSSYSSSSEDSKYRSKKSRVRIRKHVVSRKKKTSRRSYSSESSEDSRGARKRAGSKRKRNRENKNKMYTKKKKKRRRDDSVSSTIRSRSCSTCQDDSSSSHGVESERYGKKHGKEERDERNLDEVESASKKSRFRSRIPLCSESSEYGMKDKVSTEHNSRRLRSVITIVERDEEDRDFSRDEHKEEIVYDHDDYPSCRSNDSNDTGRPREEGDNGSPIDREKKIRLENEKGGGTVDSNFRPLKMANNDDLYDGNDGDRFDGSNRGSDEFAKANTVNEKMNDVSGSVGDSNSDDLESILRQRALENLRRFRGVVQTNGRTADSQKGQIDGDTKPSSFSNVELVLVGSAAMDGSKMICANSTEEDGPEVVVSTKIQLASGIRVPVPKEASLIDENRTDRNTGCNESVLAKQNVASSINRTEVAGNSSEKVKVGISAAKPKLVRPALMRQLSKSNSTLNQAPGQQEPQTELLATGSNLDETGAVTAPTLIHNPENNGIDINNAHNSAAAEPSLPSSDKPKDEANEGSQFEQKTMSVMRGGEMVQVSYKVYIPKKAPALARRQLKR